MRRVREWLWEAFHIFFRHYNFPCELGLIRLGNPDERSPVFLSGNYTLTVQRLLRVLRGVDGYLLVANARGSNVWCAAGMNEFSEHDVIDAITVADLGSRVKHRQIVAPPYAAPGVDTGAVKRETGFTLKWGPTHLNDLPRYIRNGYKRTNDMVQVQFGFQDRMEQALSTATAYTLTLAVGLFFWPRFILGVVAIVWGVYLLGFALWWVLPDERRWHKTLTMAAAGTVVLALLGWARGWTPLEFLGWELPLLGVVALMAMDACGSTPVHKSTITHWVKNGDYDSHFDPVVDPSLCTNCMACVLVCPKNVFASRRDGEKLVVSVHPDQCIECLACVKQCDDEAIFNRSGEYKDDVKSIPDLDRLMTRDTSHLRDEDRWIHHPIAFRNGLPVLAAAALQPDAAAAGELVP